MAAVMITEEPRAERRLPTATTTTRLRLVPPPVARSRRAASVYRRRRFVAVLLALGIVIVAGRAGGALGGSSLATPESRPSVIYVVQPGDTLWEIAATLAPERDPREVVDAIADVRGNGPLEIGERITWLGE